MGEFIEKNSGFGVAGAASAAGLTDAASAAGLTDAAGAASAGGPGGLADVAGLKGLGGLPGAASAAGLTDAAGAASAGGPGGLADVAGLKGLGGLAGAASAGGPGGISPMELIGKGVALSFFMFCNSLVYYPTMAIRMLEMPLSEIFEKNKKICTSIGFSEQNCDDTFRCLIKNCKFYVGQQGGYRLSKNDAKRKKQKMKKTKNKVKSLRKNKVKSLRKNKVKSLNNFENKLTAIHILNRYFKNRIRKEILKYDKLIKKRRNKRLRKKTYKSSNSNSKRFTNKKKRIQFGGNEQGDNNNNKTVHDNNETANKEHKEYLKTMEVFFKHEDFTYDDIFKLWFMIYVLKRKYGEQNPSRKRFDGNDSSSSLKYPASLYEKINPQDDTLALRISCLYNNLTKSHHTDTRCCPKGDKCMTTIKSSALIWKQFLDYILKGNLTFQIRDTINIIHERLIDKYVNVNGTQNKLKFCEEICEVLRSVQEEGMKVKLKKAIEELFGKIVPRTISSPRVEELQEENQKSEKDLFKDMYDKLCGAGLVYFNEGNPSDIGVDIIDLYIEKLKFEYENNNDNNDNNDDKYGKINKMIALQTYKTLFRR